MPKSLGSNAADQSQLYSNVFSFNFKMVFAWDAMGDEIDHGLPVYTLTIIFNIGEVIATSNATCRIFFYNILTGQLLIIPHFSF